MTTGAALGVFHRYAHKRDPVPAMPAITKCDARHTQKSALGVRTDRQHADPNSSIHQPTKEPIMMLLGNTNINSNMHLHIKSKVLSDGHVLLQPFYGQTPYYQPGDPMTDSLGGPELWTADEVSAAANWWSDVANNIEPQDARHVRFGGGIAFGRVHPHETADVAIDVIVLADPDAELPDITYDYDGRGHTSVDVLATDDEYFTVDTTTEEVMRAADWWDDLRRKVTK